MWDYDDMWLGVGNAMHPANQEPKEEEEFESDNINDCMVFAKEKDDFEPLENAIYKQEKIIENSIIIIEFCQDMIRHNDNEVLKTKLQALKNLLKSNKK